MPNMLIMHICLTLFIVVQSWFVLLALPLSTGRCCGPDMLSAHPVAELWVDILVPEKARACREKLCACLQIISTAEMRRRLVGDDRVFVCAVDPGLVITNVVRTTPGWMQYLYRVLLTTLLVSPKEGEARPCIQKHHTTIMLPLCTCYALISS